MKVFALKFFKGENVNANKGKGYIYPLYKDGQTVQRAMGIMAELYLWGVRDLMIKEDKDLAKKYVQEELEKFPSSREDFVVIWCLLLAESKIKEGPYWK